MYQFLLMLESASRGYFAFGNRIRYCDATSWRRVLRENWFFSVLPGQEQTQSTFPECPVLWGARGGLLRWSHGGAAVWKEGLGGPRSERGHLWSARVLVQASGSLWAGRKRSFRARLRGGFTVESLGANGDWLSWEKLLFPQHRNAPRKTAGPGMGSASGVMEWFWQASVF